MKLISEILTIGRTEAD